MSDLVLLCCSFPLLFLHVAMEEGSLNVLASFCVALNISTQRKSGGAMTCYRITKDNCSCSEGYVLVFPVSRFGCCIVVVGFDL